MAMKIIEGDLIKLALAGKFDAIAHGCNCMCTQKSGIAKQMVENFGTDKYNMEGHNQKGNEGKLGHIEGHYFRIEVKKNILHIMVFNFYTQFMFATKENKNPFDYVSFHRCLSEYSLSYSHMHLGIPMIGAGLGGGNWDKIKFIIEQYDRLLNITVVMLPEDYKKFAIQHDVIQINKQEV